MQLVVVRVLRGYTTGLGTIFWVHNVCVLWVIRFLLKVGSGSHGLDSCVSLVFVGFFLLGFAFLFFSVWVVVTPSLLLSLSPSGVSGYRVACQSITLLFYRIPARRCRGFLTRGVLSQVPVSTCLVSAFLSLRWSTACRGFLSSFLRRFCPILLCSWTVSPP